MNVTMESLREITPAYKISFLNYFLYRNGITFRSNEQDGKTNRDRTSFTDTISSLEKLFWA